ncbi:MAG TPA: RHS repeat-associated core domain-containing protein [Spirillospora sp.]|nr:RHS repeat-associated core domain-containing protein [Spirillospora sp.]
MAPGGGKAASIITKSVERLLDREAVTVTERTVVKDAEKTAARTAEKDAGRAAERTAGRDAGTAAREGTPGRPPADRTVGGDPIDVASGEVLLPQTDAVLPGVLPLVFERIHLSTYRQGRLFGVSWASTLDQHLEVHQDGVWLTLADGTIAAYPLPPTPGTPVAPLNGPVRPLSLGAGGGYTVEDPQRDRFLHFPPPGGAFGARLPIGAISDRSGNRIDFDHDAAGDLVEVRHSGGYRVAVEGDGTGAGRRVTALLLRTGDGDLPLMRYRYDPAGRLTEVINSSGLPLTFTYDAASRMTGWRDRNGNEYRYTYDDRGRAVRGSGTGGFLDTWLQYDENQTVLTDSLGRRTTYRFDERGRIVSERDPLGRVTLSAWDERGNLLTRTDPLGRTFRYRHDEFGDVTGIERPDGTRIRVEYNDHHQPARVSCADGTEWAYEYDTKGRLVAETDPSGATIRYTRDAHGALTGLTDPLGFTTRIENDAAGLPVGITGPSGERTRYQRDALGRLVAHTDAIGGRTRYDWTPEGLPTRRVDPLGLAESWEYDAEGNQTAYTDQLGQVVRTEYGPFDHPLRQVGPDGSTVALTYDTELQIVAVTDPAGARWTYGYDSAGNIVSETDVNGRMLRYSHDAGNQLVTRVNGAGEVTEFQRDLLGRVVAQRSAAGTSTYAYDPNGRMIRATNAHSEVVFERDPLGRVVAETCDGRTVRTDYDPLGRRMRRRTPSGWEAAWAYDPSGRLTALVAGGRRLGFDHDALGRETRRRLGDTVVLDQQYDAAGRLTSQALWGAPTARTGPDARLLQHRTHAYREDGSPTAVNDRRRGQRLAQIDGHRRITSVHGAAGVEQYGYDLAGNVTAATWPGPAAPQDIAAVQGDRVFTGTLLRRAGRTQYQHDQQGRLVVRRQTTLSGGRRDWRYFWDADDRLVALVTPDGAHWRYRYDALGRRIAKERVTADGQTVLERTSFTWDGPVLVEQQRDDTVTTWAHEPGSLVPLLQDVHSSDGTDARFHAIVADLVGAPAELVTPGGDVVSADGGSIWGADTAREAGAGGGVPCPLRFPGQYHDDESGFHYNYHRYYDPETARYISADPIGLAGGPNPHAYVPNPWRWADPFGLAPDYSGLSQEAKQAMNKLENVADDPLGKINRQTDHNHFKAARLESQGVVVARKPVTNVPYSHIHDLQQARNALQNNIIPALDREISRLERRLPDDLTHEALTNLFDQHERANKLFHNVNGFLHGIGYPPSAPMHHWPPGA